MCCKTRDGDLVFFKSRHSSSSAVWEYHPVIPFGDGPHPDFWFPSCGVVSIWTLNWCLVSENCERVEQLESKCAVLIFKSVESPSFDFSFFFLDAINKTCGEKTSGVERAMTDGRCLTCRLINFTTVRLEKHHVCSSTSVKRLETVQPRLKEEKSVLSSHVLCCIVLSSSSPLPAGWSFSMGSAYQFHSWRVFVVVCALPCVSAVVALTFMPESPRFFLEVRARILHFWAHVVGFSVI